MDESTDSDESIELGEGFRLEERPGIYDDRLFSQTLYRNTDDGERRHWYAEGCRAEA